MKSIRKLVGIALTLAVVAGGVACTAQPNSETQEDSVLRMVAASGFLSLDPQVGQFGNTSTFYVNVFDGLYTVDSDGQVIPSLAVASETNEDYTQYTFTLREGVTFHDGSALTSADVKFTLERAIDPETKSPSAGDLGTIESVETDGPYTVIVNLRASNPILHNTLLSMGALVLPQEYFEEVGAEEFARKPVGSGPFMLTEYAEGQRAVLERFEDYWNGPAKSDRLEFLFASEVSTQTAMIQSGQADLIMGIDVRHRAQLESAGLNVLSTSSGDPLWTLFQAQKGVEDARVRQALNYAINKEQIIEAVYQGEAEALGGMISPSLPGFDGLKPYPYDPEEAERLLNEAGFDFSTPIVITLAEGRYPGSDVVAQSMVADLKAVGVRASVNVMEFGAMGEQLVTKAATNPLINMGNRTYDPLAGLVSQTTCDGLLSTTCDDEYESLISKASSLSGDDRAQALAEVNQYLHDNPAGIFLFEPRLITVMSPKVKYSPAPGTNVPYNLATATVAR